MSLSVTWTFIYILSLNLAQWVMWGVHLVPHKSCTDPLLCSLWGVRNQQHENAQRPPLFPEGYLWNHCEFRKLFLTAESHSELQNSFLSQGWSTQELPQNVASCKPEPCSLCDWDPAVSPCVQGKLPTWCSTGGCKLSREQRQAVISLSTVHEGCCCPVWLCVEQRKTEKESVNGWVKSKK